MFGGLGRLLFSRRRLILQSLSFCAVLKSKGPLAAAGSLTDLKVLRSVFVAREGRLLAQLGDAMAQAGKAETFELWMKQQSDLVQGTAFAYADREVLEASLRSLSQVDCSSPGLTSRLVLWITSIPQKDLDYYTKICKYRAFMLTTSLLGCPVQVVGNLQFPLSLEHSPILPSTQIESGNCSKMHCSEKRGFADVQVSSTTAEVLGDVIQLHALRILEKNLAWLMAEQLLPLPAGKQVPELIRSASVQHLHLHYLHSPDALAFSKTVKTLWETNMDTFSIDAHDYPARWRRRKPPFRVASLLRDLSACWDERLRILSTHSLQFRALCHKLAPQAQQLAESFGIPDHLIAAPIAEDWEGFNVSDNQGEARQSVCKRGTSRQVTAEGSADLTASDQIPYCLYEHCIGRSCNNNGQKCGDGTAIPRT